MTGVTLTIPTSQAPWNPAYAKLVAEYEKETGNKVVLRPFPNPDVKTQEVNDIQSQQHTFDVFQINEQDVAQFAANKWLEPFTQVVPGFALDPQVYSYSSIGRWNATANAFDPSGGLIAAPLLGNVDIFAYRKDIYSTLGLSVPTTWAQVISNGQKIQAAHAAKYGGVFRTQGQAGTYTISFEFQALLTGAGTGWFKAPGTNYTPTVDNAAGDQAATWLRDLAQLGPAATTTIGQAQVISTMQAGDAGETYLVAAGASNLEDPASSNVVGKIGYAPLPPAPDGTSASATGLWVLGIPSGLPPARAKAALSYIQWITSAKAQTLFAQYGGIPVRSDAYNPPGISASQQQALNATKQTATNLPDKPTGLRYEFSTDLLEVTEPALQDIAAGTVSPQQGMQTIQSGLESIVEKNKLPTG